MGVVDRLRVLAIAHAVVPLVVAVTIGMVGLIVILSTVPVPDLRSVAGPQVVPVSEMARNGRRRDSDGNRSGRVARNDVADNDTVVVVAIAVVIPVISMVAMVAVIVPIIPIIVIIPIIIVIPIAISIPSVVVSVVIVIIAITRRRVPTHYLSSVVGVVKCEPDPWGESDVEHVSRLQYLFQRPQLHAVRGEGPRMDRNSFNELHCPIYPRDVDSILVMAADLRHEDPVARVRVEWITQGVLLFPWHGHAHRPHDIGGQKRIFQQPALVPIGHAADLAVREQEPVCRAIEVLDLLDVATDEQAPQPSGPEARPGRIESQQIMSPV